MNTDNLKKEVRKLKIGHIALLCAGVFLAFSIIGSIILFASGGWNLWSSNGHFNWNGFLPLGPGQTYDVNEHKEFSLDGVSRIDVLTISDDVVVAYGGTSAVAELKGQYKTSSKSKWLDARMQGSTLIIEVKYPATFGSVYSDTKLTVTIPDSYAGDLSIGTTSGNVYASDLPFRLGSVWLNSVSGDIAFGTASSADLSARTISGRVELTGIAWPARVETTSGSIDLDYASFTETTVSSISGHVAAVIPNTQSFLVDFNSVSGVFTSKHPNLGVSNSERGFHGGTPGGEATLKVNTTSGVLEITGK